MLSIDLLDGLRLRCQPRHLLSQTPAGCDVGLAASPFMQHFESGEERKRGRH